MKALFIANCSKVGAHRLQLSSFLLIGVSQSISQSVSQSVSQWIEWNFNNLYRISQHLHTSFSTFSKVISCHIYFLHSAFFPSIKRTLLKFNHYFTPAEYPLYEKFGCNVKVSTYQPPTLHTKFWNKVEE